MAVNTLVTGLFVLKVFLEIKATSVEQTLGSLESNAGGAKLRHVILVFLIIESGMALFVIQLALVVMVYIPVPVEQEFVWAAATDFVIVINRMLIVIITTSVHFYFF